MRTDERIALLDQMRRVKEQGEKEVQAPEEKTLTLEDALAALSEGKLELEDGRLLEFEICPYFKEEFPYGSVKRLVLDRKKIGEHKVFLADTKKFRNPFVSLEIVESILRRNPVGIIFREVEVE